MAYHRLTYLLVAIGGFILGYSSGPLSPFSLVLVGAGAFALAAGLAPSKGSLLSVTLAMSIGPILVAVYLMLSALSGGRSTINPDPMGELFAGLSMAFVAGAVWFHFAHVRNGTLTPSRLVYLCVGLAFVSTAIPDLLSEHRQPIGMRYLVIGLLPIAFAALPNRVTAALMIVGFLAGLVGLALRLQNVLEDPAIVVVQPRTITVVQLIGALVLYCAVGVQLAKAYVDASSRRPPA